MKYLGIIAGIVISFVALADNVQVYSSGDNELSLNQQVSSAHGDLFDQKPAKSNNDEDKSDGSGQQTMKPISAASVDLKAESTGFEGEIQSLGQDVNTMFKNASKNINHYNQADGLMLYVLFKQAQQNQILLAQNNEILSQLTLLNRRLATR